MDMSVTQATKQAKISEKRCIDIYQYMRDVCSAKLSQAPIILGGPGTIVQIDESLFILERYKSSSVSFCAFIFNLLQNGRCRPPSQEQWVLGWWTHPQDLL